ncbi:MAG: tetratricopeptide repeat protein [Kiritimatiellia bacterium]
MTGWRLPLAAGLAALLLFPLAAAALTAEEQQRFADGLFSRGLHEMALAEYRRAIEQFPDYAERDVLLFRASECSRKLGQGPQSLDYLRQIVAGNKPGVYLDRARLRLAEQLVQAGRVKDAIPLLDAILAGKPGGDTGPAALYYLGLARVKNGEKEIGRRGFAGILTQHPDSSFAPYAALELARLLNEAGSPFAEIKAMTDRVLARPPSESIALETRLLLVDAANRRDDFQGASDAFLQLLKASPQDPRVRDSALKAAWACLRSSKFAEVLDVLKAVPDDVRASHEADVLYLEANALRKTGKDSDALARYNDLAARHAQSPYAPYAAYETALTAYAGTFGFALAFDTCAADSDLDGVPDWYENQFAFLDRDNPLDAGDDEDQDGVSNRGEYIAGTAPDSFSSKPQVQQITQLPNGVQIRFPTVAGRTYRVWYRNHSLDSPPGVWTQAPGVQIAGTGGVVTWVDDGSATSPSPVNPDLRLRFYRFEVELTSP